MKIKIYTQLIYSLVFKLISMILVFLTTSLTFKYLGKSDYGIWVTIYSIISWVYFLDFGFSNVIKTKLPTLLQDKQKEVNVLVKGLFSILRALDNDMSLFPFSFDLLSLMYFKFLFSLATILFPSFHSVSEPFFIGSLCFTLGMRLPLNISETPVVALGGILFLSLAVGSFSESVLYYILWVCFYV